MMPVPAAAQASPSPKTSLSAIPPPAEQAATSEWTNAGADTSAVAQHHEADAVIPDLPVAADWNELAALLRIAIDHRKRYPQGALILGREGTARVDFQLDPIGGIEDVAIIASSGVHALDVAASQAVQGIAPFTVAGRYLNNAQRFQVDVVFSLD
ncbi:MAG: energy transducer TonB [Gammaproteobacteria bacterium]|nr:energy transducer TonB [Gammaproteobacteria bacterium]